MQKDIGTFENISGKFMVSDPCYKKGVWCQGVLENVMKGTWDASIELSSDERIAVLIASHEDTGNVSDDDLTEQSFVVGVDSGQAGIFDELHYRDDSVFPKNQRPAHDFDDNSKWYGLCCDKTLSNESAGVIPFGAVASSGYGDGSYVCLTHTNSENLIDYVKIVFIDEELDEDYYEDDEYDYDDEDDSDGYDGY